MSARFRRQIDFLLDNACESIKFLVHRDLLHTPTSEPFMVKMRGEILMQENIKKHLASQHEDGWFGDELHGGEYGMERSIGTLLNAGVEREHEAIQRAITALTTPEISSRHKNWFHGGDALDAEERGGNKAMIAAILSWVGHDEDHPILREQITLSWEHLAAVKEYRSVDDFSKKGKNERYYLPKARFPGANHIGLLNAAKSWRSDERMAEARSAASHAYEIMKDVNEYITFKKPKEFGGGFVGPFNYNWQALTPINGDGLRRIINDPYNFAFAFWLGAVTGVPDWMRQSDETYNVLAEFLEDDTALGMIPDRTISAFRKVSGKEPSYRKRNAARCDITYALLRAVWDVVE